MPDEILPKHVSIWEVEKSFHGSRYGSRHVFLGTLSEALQYVRVLKEDHRGDRDLAEIVLYEVNPATALDPRGYERERNIDFRFDYPPAPVLPLPPNINADFYDPRLEPEYAER